MTTAAIPIPFMAMNSYVLDGHLRGISFYSMGLADQVGLRRLIESQTGLSLSTYLSDRVAAYRVKMAVREWVVENCQVYLDAFPYEDSGMSPEEVLDYATGAIYWSLVCQEYGKGRAIAVRNRILQDSSIRQEFLAEGDAASSRDFSYLLDLPERKP